VVFDGGLSWWLSVRVAEDWPEAGGGGLDGAATRCLCVRMKNEVGDDGVLTYAEIPRLFYVYE
jgi:hypothetical protein